MIKIILEEDDILITDFINANEFKLLKEIGVTESDRLISTMKKINRYLCKNHHKGAVFMIDEDDLTEQEKELLKLRKKLKKKKHI